MEPRLRDALACPACRSPLVDGPAGWLVCADPVCRRRYPVRGEAPVLLVSEGDRWRDAAIADLPSPGAAAERPAAPPRRRAYRNRLYSIDHLMVRHLRRFTTTFLRDHVRPGALVGDVGCGEQPLRPLVTDLGGQYLGLDVEQNLSGTVAAVGGLPHLPLADAQLDVTLCTEVLEHVPDLRANVAELARVTRSGGYVAISTPFVYQLHEVPHDYLRPTTYGLRQACTEAGLSVEQLTAAGTEVEVLAAVWCRMWRSAADQAGARWLRALGRCLAAAASAPANAAALATARLAPGLFPHRLYLSTLCVLRKE